MSSPPHRYTNHNHQLIRDSTILALSPDDIDSIADEIAILEDELTHLETASSYSLSNPTSGAQLNISTSLDSNIDQIMDVHANGGGDDDENNWNVELVEETPQFIDDNKKCIEEIMIRIVFDLKDGYQRERRGGNLHGIISNGRILAGRYRIVNICAMSTSCQVARATDLTIRDRNDDNRVSLKVIHDDKIHLDACIEEIRVLTILNNADPDDEKCILRLLDSFYYHYRLVMVTECLQLDLYQAMKRDQLNCPNQHETFFCPAVIQAIASDLLQAIEFVHALGIIHADIKPENIMISSYTPCHVKLIDFGCAVYSNDITLPRYAQSRSYRAPEVITGEGLCQHSDIWSIGCVLAELCSRGKVLFPPGNNADDVLNHQIKIMKSSLLHQTLHNTIRTNDNLFIDLLSKLLQFDCTQRISANLALQHPWFYQYFKPTHAKWMQSHD